MSTAGIVARPDFPVSKKMLATTAEEYRQLTKAIHHAVHARPPASPLDAAIAEIFELNLVGRLWDSQMIMEDKDGLVLDILRVSIDDDGKFDIVDFTTPSRSGKVLHRQAPQEDVPTWIIETISVLRIAEANSEIAGVGFKLSDRVYYIIDRRDEHDL